MMKITSVLSCFLLFALVGQGHAYGQCKITDVAIVVEIPQGGNRNTVFEQLNSFFRSIVFGRFPCIQFSLTLVDNEINTVLDFQCDQLKCKMDTLKKVLQVKSKKVHPHTDVQTTKVNLIKFLTGIDTSIFSQSRDAREGANKVIVLICSSADVPNSKIRISDYTKGILENGYKIIAVGVGGDQKLESLFRITFERNRIILVDSFKKIGFFAKNRENNNLINLIKDPVEESDSVFQLGSSDPVRGYTESVPEGEKCKLAVDIAFVVDSSLSIKQDYAKELLFVQRVANRFGISESGTHAGVVLFSNEGKYTKVSIKLNDYNDTKSFNDAVANSEFIGFQTRIDYALQKVENELFKATENDKGARPNMNKIIILLTDGKQNPTKNWTTSVPFDPVAASQSMVDDGVKIFVVGIGQDLDKTQLEDIARDKKRVYYADTIEKLISDNFVKEVSRETCKPVKRNITTSGPIKINVTVAPSPCGGVGNCGSCCGSRDIYINIFQPNSGQHYVMQGMRLAQSGNGFSLTGDKLPKMKPSVDLSTVGKSTSTQQIISLLKGVLPNNADLADALQNMLQTNNLGVGLPGLSTESKRKRRSIGKIENMENDPALVKLAKLAGCNLFFTALHKYGILENILADFLSTKKHVTIFCPIDEAFKKVYQSDTMSTKEKHLLLNHIAVRNIKDGTMFQMPKKDRITLRKRENDKGKSAWFANDVKIHLSFTNGTMGGQIIVTEDIFKPRVQSVEDVLKSNKNLTMFYSLWARSSAMDLFITDSIQKMCFLENLCVTVSKEMQNHLRNELKYKQFTILAPTDDVLSKMEKTKLKSLLNNKQALKEFLQEYIYLGILQNHNGPQEVSHSLSTKHSVLTTGIHDNTMVLIDANNKLLKVKKSIAVTEGIVHIIEKME